MPLPGGTGRGPDARVILVDGIDGSGKTTFAGLLVEGIRRRGNSVVLLHVDDFRRGIEWALMADEAAAYWESYFDLSALEREVGRLADRDRTVVLEGIFTLRLSTLTRAPLVYLEVGFERAADRVFRRDTARGRPPEDVRHRITHRYFPAQRRYREEFRPLERADLLIDTSDLARLRLVRCDWAMFPEPVVPVLRQLLGPVRPPLSGLAPGG